MEEGAEPRITEANVQRGGGRRRRTWRFGAYNGKIRLDPWGDQRGRRESAPLASGGWRSDVGGVEKEDGLPAVRREACSRMTRHRLGGGRAVGGWAAEAAGWA